MSALGRESRIVSRSLFDHTCPFSGEKWNVLVASDRLNKSTDHYAGVSGHTETLSLPARLKETTVCDAWSSL